jgi:O-antigen/teichoic acid export membrane protein
LGNIYKKLVGQTAIYGLSSIIGRLLNYLLVPLYTRLFAPEVYGVVVELYAYIGFLLIFLTYGMETGFFRFSQTYKKPDELYSTIILSLFSTSTLFIIFVYSFLTPIASLLDYSANPEYIFWLSLIVGIDAVIAVPFAKLRLQEKAIKFATIKLINIGINIGSNLFFLILCPYILKMSPESKILVIYSENIGVGYVFISNLIANIVTLLILLSELFNIKFSFNITLLKRVLIYTLPLLIAGFAGMINETLDRLLLKYLLPESVNAMEQIGIYGANYKLAILMTLFIQMFRYAAEPFFFSQFKEKDSKHTYAQVTKYFVLCGLCIFLGVMLYIDIIKFFIDESYHSGLTVVPILLLANLFLGIFFNLSIWYKLNDLTKYGAYLAIIGAIITVVINVLLIPKYGYMGSAIATLICYFSMTVISYLWGNKYYKVNYDIKNISLYFVITGIIYSLSILIKFENNILDLSINTLLLLSFIGFIIYRENFKRLITRQ